MTTVVDTGGIFALYDIKDRHHRAVKQFIETSGGPFVVPLPVAAEVDYFLIKYLGQAAALDFLESLSSGAFLLDHLSTRDIERSRRLIERFEDLELGFVDASVLAVAERLHTREILTTDHRDFRAVGSNRHGDLILRPTD